MLQQCASASALTAFDASPLKLLFERYTRCGEGEDAVSIALTCVSRLLRRFHVQPTDVGMIQLGSSSLLDRSKCMKSELMGLLERAGCIDVEGTDHCDSARGSISALLNCVRWTQGANWDGRWAVVVSVDEADLGSVAAAALVGPSNPLVCDSCHASSKI